MVGFKSKEDARGIYAMSPGGMPKAISENIGRLDGVYEMSDGALLVSDWNSGSLFSWDKMGGMTTLASGFTGPADLCAMPHMDGLLVVVPDLVKSTLRIVQLGN